MTTNNTEKVRVYHILWGQMWNNTISIINYESPVLPFMTNDLPLLKVGVVIGLGPNTVESPRGSHSAAVIKNTCVFNYWEMSCAMSLSWASVIFHIHSDGHSGPHASRSNRSRTRVRPVPRCFFIVVLSMRQAERAVIPWGGTILFVKLSGGRSIPYTLCVSVCQHWDIP